MSFSVKSILTLCIATCATVFVPVNAQESVIEARHNHHHHRHNHISAETAEMVNLWRMNAFYINDGLRVNAAGGPANEQTTVNNLMAQSSMALNTAIYGMTVTGTGVQMALDSMNTNLYAYIQAYLNNAANLPTIISNLEQDNDALLAAILSAGSFKHCDEFLLRNALNERLESLKDLALGYVAAQTGEYDGLYDELAQLIFESVRVGINVGKYSHMNGAFSYSS